MPTLSRRDLPPLRRRSAPAVPPLPVPAPANDTPAGGTSGTEAPQQQRQGHNMSSIWDDPDFAVSDGEFIKFERVGDSVTGTITRIGKKVWDDGTVSPQIDLNTEAGSKVVTAGQTRLKAKLHELKPDPGDRITITFVDEEPAKKGKVKVFDVKVEKAAVVAANARLGSMAGGAPAAAPAGDDEPPF